MKSLFSLLEDLELQVPVRNTGGVRLI